MTAYQKEQRIRPKAAPNTIVSGFPSTLLDHPPKPGPVSAWKRFMGTRAFCIYFFVIIHGIGMAAFELCNKAIPVIVYPKKIKLLLEVVKTSNALSVKNEAGGGSNITASKTYEVSLNNTTGNEVTETSTVTASAASGLVDTDYITYGKEVDVTTNVSLTANAGKKINIASVDNSTNKVELKATNEASDGQVATVTLDTTSTKFNPSILAADYVNDSNLVQAGQAADINDPVRGYLITVNILTFAGTNLFVIWLFSWVRYYVHGNARLAETFFLISILFLGGQGVILYFFHDGTDKARNDTTGTGAPIKDPSTSYTKGSTSLTLTATAAINSGNSGSVSLTHNLKATVFAHVHRKTSTEADLPTKIYSITDLEKVALLCCLTVFHSTVFFWIFTGGPLTFYVSENILNHHNGIRAFGVATILIGFGGATFIFAALALPNDSTLNSYIFSARCKKSILFICIATQFFTLWVFKPFCNKCGQPQYWKTYLTLVATGATNTMLVTYIYIVLDDVIKTYRLNWFCYGVFFCVTNFIISKAMGIMFGAFGDQGDTGFKLSSTQVVVKHCFPCVYKSITIFFWLANGLALLPIFSNNLS